MGEDVENGELILSQKEYSKFLFEQQLIQHEIASAIRKGKEDITVGKRRILIAKLLETEDEDKNTTGYYRAKSTDGKYTAKAIAKQNKKGKIKVDVDIDIEKIRIISDEKAREKRENERKIKKHEIDNKDPKYIEQLIQQGLNQNRVAEMDSDREISDTENLRMFVRRRFGIDSIAIYRVQGKDVHDFRYIAKTKDGGYKEIPLSQSHEGRNSLQKIILMKDGKVTEKTVDSLLIKGNYGIATDFPESVGSQNTTSYIVQRLPNGQYLAVSAGQRYGVNRNSSSNSIDKGMLARTGNTKHEVQKYAEAAKMAENIYLLNNDNKLTSEEVKLVENLKKEKNLSDNQVIDAVEIVVGLKEDGFERSEVHKVMESIDDARQLKGLNEVIKEAGNDLEVGIVKKLLDGGKLDKNINKDVNKDVNGNKDKEGKSHDDNVHVLGGGNPHHWE